MKPIPFNALAKLLDFKHSDQTLISGVAIDSRMVKAGDLFFALPGNRVNGEDFLAAAISNGAVAAVVSTHFKGDASNLPLLRVPNVLSALQKFAQKSLEKRKSKVIAITGSLGKTTVKEFAATLLCTRYHVFSSPLSYNSQATVPLSILMADETEDYLILEMGMTHEKELAKLVSIAQPDIALLTTVAAQHTVNFPDGLSGISREKASIFSHPNTKIGFLDHDVHDFETVYQTGTCLKSTFSTVSKEADFYLECLEKGVRIHTKKEELFDIPLNLPIDVHYHNFLAAVALARAVDIPWHLIRESTPFIKLPPMRFEKCVKQGITFVNDAYNANPDSMKAALEGLPKPQPGGKTIAVLSEMNALGMYAEEGHILVAQAALIHTDLLLCIGKGCEIMCAIWKKEGKPSELFQELNDLEKALKSYVKSGDVVLLKGARSYELDQILNQF